MITGNTEKNIRPPAVASMFYPGGTAELRNTVQKYLSNASVEENVSQLKKEEIAQLRTLIVPHAGYIYSGKIAACAYQLLLENQKRFKHVLLLGPAHRVWLEGAAFPEADAFETPLGEIALDKELKEKYWRNFHGFLSVTGRMPKSIVWKCNSLFYRKLLVNSNCFHWLWEMRKQNFLLH